VGGAHGVAVAALAVDVLAAVLRHGVVAGDHDRRVGRQQIQDQAGQHPAEGPGGPGGAGEDAVVVAKMALGPAAHRGQDTGDGASAGGQDGADGEQQESLGGRVGEGVGQGEQERRGGRGQGKHRRLLSGSWVVTNSGYREEPPYWQDITSGARA
jgi:hypothetical protein